MYRVHYKNHDTKFDESTILVWSFLLECCYPNVSIIIISQIKQTNILTFVLQIWFLVCGFSLTISWLGTLQEIGKCSRRRWGYNHIKSWFCLSQKFSCKNVLMKQRPKKKGVEKWLETNYSSTIPIICDSLNDKEINSLISIRKNGLIYTH